MKKNLFTAPPVGVRLVRMPFVGVSLVVVSLIVAVVMSLLAPVSAHAQAPAPSGDAKAGRAKAQAICSGCHGVPGMRTAFPEVYDVPKIGGQNQGYLVAALKAYRSGERYNQTMKALASSLSDKEVVDIAAYYAQTASTAEGK